MKRGRGGHKNPVEFRHRGQPKAKQDRGALLSGTDIKREKCAEGGRGEGAKETVEGGKPRNLNCLAHPSDRSRAGLKRYFSALCALWKHV